MSNFSQNMSVKCQKPKEFVLDRKVVEFLLNPVISFLFYQGINVELVDDNLFQWRVFLAGLKGTLWQGIVIIDFRVILLYS